MIEVPTHGGRFASTSAGLRSKLVDAIAERDGLPIHGDVRPDFFRAKAEDAANAAIAAWERSPRQPEDAVERTLADMAANYQRWQADRQERADERAAADAQRRAAAIAAEPPKEFRLRFLDQNTGREVEITLAAAQVRFLGEAAR